MISGSSSSSRNRHYYYVALAFLLLALAVTAWLERSAIGHRLVAIRENEDAAQALGVNLLRYKLFATALSAFLTALGGTLYAHYVTFIDPHTLLNMNMALEITIYAIVGGVGTLWGPAARRVVPGAAGRSRARGVRSELCGHPSGVYGAVLIGVILFAPDGFMGLLRSIREWRPRRAAATRSSEVRHEPARGRGTDQNLRRASRRRPM